MRFLEKMAQVSDMLDEMGQPELAERVDVLIKAAVDMADKIVKDRFWSKVDKGLTPSACHIWTAAKDSSGYGICTINGKNHSAHKLSWQWKNGKPVPKGYMLLHTCDTPSCVNAKHLTLGTGNENVADRVLKGRSAKGPANGRARLTEKDVRKIRKLRAKGWTEKAIAQLFGVGRSTISHACKKHTWNWLDD